MEKQINFDYRNEDLIVHCIDNKIEIPSDILRGLIYYYGVETNQGEKHRWTTDMATIVKLLDRYFLIDWCEGNTEYQENEYYNQPVEVIKEEKEVTMKVIKWVKINE